MSRGPGRGAPASGRRRGWLLASKGPDSPRGAAEGTRGPDHGSPGVWRFRAAQAAPSRARRGSAGRGQTGKSGWKGRPAVEARLWGTSETCKAAVRPAPCPPPAPRPRTSSFW